MLLFLLACTNPASDGLGPAEDTGLPTVIGGGGDTADTGPTISDADWQAGWFADDVIQTVALTVSDASWSALDADPYTFTPADVRINGEHVGNVGVRLRGKIGSFRTLDQKPKLKLDFGEFESGRKFHGLQSIALNNAVVDCSYMKEALGYKVYRDLGIPASRTGFTQLTVNGEDYGLYVIVEVPDSQMLTDWFPGDDQGQLYDGKYLYYKDGSYTLLDFNSGVDALFQLEEGTDTANAEIVAISTLIQTGRDSPAFNSTLDPAVDWAQIHRVWAIEQWIGHVDGYAMNRNNYRAYFRPSDGKMVFIPWDFDYAFIEDWEWGMSWRSPIGTLASGCYGDPDCLAAQVEAVGDTVAEVDQASLIAWYEQGVDLIRDAATDDPKRECSGTSIVAQRQSLRTWLETRSTTVAAYWGVE